MTPTPAATLADAGAPAAPARSRAYTFVSYTVGPAYLAAAVAIFCVVDRHFHSKPFACYLIMNFCVIVMTQALELAFPYEKSWVRPDDQLPNEIGSTFVAATLGHKAGRALAYACFGWVLTWSRGEAGATPWWPTGLPFALQIMLAFTLWEFGLYWSHRFMHGPAWRYHVLHHKLRRLSWINSGYGHPVGFFLTSVFSYGMLALSGAPADVLLFTGYLSLSINFISHANVDMKMGYLNLVLNTPELHRWHHVREPASSGRNFGTQLTVWDIVFGTYYLPKGRLPGRTLGDDTPVPAGFFAQWLAPFRWKQSTGWKPAIPDERRPFRLFRTSPPSPAGDTRPHLG